MAFLDHLNLLKSNFTQNWSSSKIIKFQQSQAFTSHFESFWSIVMGVMLLGKQYVCKLKLVIPNVFEFT